jgi:Asp-tRNA(Asn)/Glu-tRNA(Gln) amidotransferase A subunit family amidase
MSLDDLLKRNSGLELAAAVAARQVTIGEIRTGYLAAIAERERIVKAFAHFDCEKFLASTLVAGPLEGLPVGFKDIIDVAGMPCECGSPIYRNYIPRSDAPIVSMVRRAGGTVAGKTVTSEFATREPGPTTNPRDPTRTPGGSSSGSAAAVAAGFLPFAIGTQTGGSTIGPASFCGVAALKPSFGLVPYSGIRATSWTLDTLGFYGRNVRDVAFLAASITGQDLAVNDAVHWMPRIGVTRMKVWEQISADMSEAMVAACDMSKSRGAHVVSLPVHPIFENAYQAQFLIQDFEKARCLAFEIDTHSALLSATLEQAIRDGWSIPVAHYVAAIDAAKRAQAASYDLFREVDVLIAPSASGAASIGLETTGSPNLNRLWTLLGLPCVSVPSLSDGSGMPLGISVVAPMGDDRRALRAASWLQETLSGGARC